MNLNSLKTGYKFGHRLRDADNSSIQKAKQKMFTNCTCFVKWVIDRNKIVWTIIAKFNRCYETGEIILKLIDTLQTLVCCGTYYAQ